MSSRASAGETEPLFRYGVVIEKARNNYAAYVPDLPGCVATGDSVEETRRLIRGVIDFHLKGSERTGSRFLNRRLRSRGLSWMESDGEAGSIE